MRVFGAMIFLLIFGNSNPNETWVPWSVKGMAMVQLLKKQQEEEGPCFYHKGPLFSSFFSHSPFFSLYMYQENINTGGSNKHCHH